MVDPIVYPPEALTAGCKASYEIFSHTNTVDGNLVTDTKNYRLTAEPAPGWRLDHFETSTDHYYPSNPGLDTEHDDFTYSAYEFYLGENFYPTRDMETGRWPRGLYEQIMTFRGDVTDDIRITMFEAHFVKIKVGDILHGSSGDILCGAAGLPLHDL